MTVQVEICSGCLISATESSSNHKAFVQMFLEEVRKSLASQKPEVVWNVSSISCQRFCPPQKVTLVIQSRLSMSPGISVEDVVHEVLSRCR